MITPPLGSFGDREMLADALANQKLLTSNYNAFANECTNNAVKSELMNILNEEHQIQHEIFDEMLQRGWYNVEQADANKINQAKQKYQSQYPV